MGFNELGLDSAMLKAVKISGYQTPSAIQAKTIPLILRGHDVIGQAQTGTGKTAAFSLPIIQKIDLQKTNVQALIVSPTRELAMQTGRAVRGFSRTRHVKVQSIYGGSDIRRQIRQLKRHPQIIVGTPGRIIDLLHRHALQLNQLRTLVLDEADDMLNMGFLPNIKEIVTYIGKNRQTLLFSATMPKAIEAVGVKFMHHPQKIAIEPQGLTTALIDQYYVRVSPVQKFAALVRFFAVYQPTSTIVFCQTKQRVEEVTKGLKTSGFRVEGLQGDLSQRDRSKVMKDFKYRRIDVLVATDVAARGIDVSSVTQVYNFDIPQDPDSYVHRIGRTGRAGRHGVAITMVSWHDRPFLRNIEQLTKVRMRALRIPSEQKALAGQMQITGAQLGRIISHKSLVLYDGAAKKLLGQYNPEALVAALLSKIVHQPAQIHIDQPRQSSGGGHRRFHGRRRGRHRHYRHRFRHSFKIKSRK